RSLPLCSGFSDLKFAERWRRGRDPRGGSHAQPTSSIVPIVPIVPSGLSPGLSETAAPALWSTRARAAGRVSRLGAGRGVLGAGRAAEGRRGRLSGRYGHVRKGPLRSRSRVHGKRGERIA